MNNTQSTELVFELSKPGRRCHRLPASDVPARPLGELIPREHLADAPPPLPEVGEIDLMRHYTNLSARNMSIDTNFYPLGSCTMKYNPKRHERLAALPGFAAVHPLQDDATCQGMLQFLYELQQILCEISGLDACSLQPAAGPHGGGGPGAGPVTVRQHLAPFLPSPVVVRDGDRYRLDYDRPLSIGRVRSFFGTIGILLRGYCYIRTLGPDGLRQVSEDAVLNANYLRARVKEVYEVPHAGPCMHEFVASARTLRRTKKISAMDVAKRLLDFGFHAPTVYFPLVVPEAIMIEPTETESKETLDRFADVLLRIANEDAEFLHDAPHTLAISRPDEVKAAKEPVLRWE